MLGVSGVWWQSSFRIGCKLVAMTAALAIVAAPARPASAHDPVGLLKSLEEDRTEDEIAQVASAVPPSDTATRSVLVNLLLWPVPHALTVCFMSGSKGTRQRVTTSMQKVWQIDRLSNNRLTYDAASFRDAPDCSAAPNADISVAFDPRGGYQSYLGLSSKKHKPSMNLAGFSETSPDDKEFDRLVAHETGHALGLHHEHQSQNAPDCGWNFDFIWKNYGWTSRDQMTSNFARLQDYLVLGKHAYVFLIYDQKSVMHYDFPEGAYGAGRNSPCFIRRNFLPSAQDRDALRMAYGGAGGGEAAAGRSLITGALERLNDPRFSSVQDLLKLKLQLSQ